jgi:predicted RecA/RadA family phage recombinase
MTTQYLSEGATITLPGAQTAESIVELADCIAYCPNAIASGETGPGIIQGKFRLPKETPLVITAGDFVYWDATNDNVDKTSTNTPLGIAAAAAASAATEVDVCINVGTPDAAV